MRVFLLLTIIIFSNTAFTKWTNVFGLGIYDIKFDGSDRNQATDFRYEYRSDESLVDIGPKEDKQMKKVKIRHIKKMYFLFLLEFIYTTKLFNSHLKNMIKFFIFL